MEIEYTGRNMNITPALRSHVREKLGHAARALEDVVGAHVILAVEKYRHIAEVVVRRRRGSLTGKASTGDMYQSIQRALERIEKQVRRRREKLITRRRRGAAEVARAARVRATGPRPEEPGRGPLVVEEPLDRVKPIALEEAALLLEAARRPFVAFRNSATGRLAVLYRRGDGRIGLVEARS